MSSFAYNNEHLDLLEARALLDARIRHLQHQLDSENEFKRELQILHEERIAREGWNAPRRVHRRRPLPPPAHFIPDDFGFGNEAMPLHDSAFGSNIHNFTDLLDNWSHESGILLNYDREREGEEQPAIILINDPDIQFRRNMDGLVNDYDSNGNGSRLKRLQ